MIDFILRNLFGNKKTIYFFIFILIIFIYFFLSIYKYPNKDELLYLCETSNMSNILSHCKWFGNDAVGWHGFLFKIPAALLFLITGPSVLAAIYYNYTLALLCVYLLYKLLRKYFVEEYLIIIGILMLVTTPYFVTASIRFLREIPALFSFLLFLNLLVNKKSKILVGLSLLLIFDAKEHIFFQLVPGFGLWLIYEHFFKLQNEDIFSRIKNFILSCILYFSPALIYLFLMFFTSLVPYNNVNAYILGLAEGGMAPLSKAYEYGTSAFIGFDNLACTLFVKYFGWNSIQNYFVKIFMPSMFSLLTIPFIIVIPSFCMSFISLIKRKSEIEEDSVLYFFLFWSFFITFYMFMGFGRYFFPVIPLVIIYFLQFIKNIRFDARNITIIVITILMISFSFLFEYKSLFPKIIINIIIIFFTLLLLYNNEKQRFDKWFIYIFFTIMLVTFPFSAIVYSIYESGQMNQALKYGICGGIFKVTETINIDSKIWINLADNKNELNLINFYRGDQYSNSGVLFKLQSWIPKSRMFKYFSDSKTFSYKYENMDDFKDNLIKNNIERVYFFVSHSAGESFYRQEEIDKIRFQKFLNLADTIELKNRKVFVFNVVR